MYIYIYIYTYIYAALPHADHGKKHACDYYGSTHAVQLSMPRYSMQLSIPWVDSCPWCLNESGTPLHPVKPMVEHSICMNAYTYLCVCMYIYIYIYTHNMLYYTCIYVGMSIYTYYTYETFMYKSLPESPPPPPLRSPLYEILWELHRADPCVPPRKLCHTGAVIVGGGWGNYGSQDMYASGPSWRRPRSPGGCCSGSRSARTSMLCKMKAVL